MRHLNNITIFMHRSVLVPLVTSQAYSASLGYDPQPPFDRLYVGASFILILTLTFSPNVLVERDYVTSLRSAYEMAIPSVCLSVRRLSSVTRVHPTQTVNFFGIIFAHYCTLRSSTQLVTLASSLTVNRRWTRTLLLSAGAVTTN